LAVDAELGAMGGGCPLLVESLATILSVHLIRHVTGRRDLPAPADGVLSGRKLYTVIEYIMENLAGDLTLAQMAAVELVCLQEIRLGTLDTHLANP